MIFNGSALEQARGRAGLTQQELAVASKTGANLISRLENGVTKNPQFGTITRIARALGIPATDLLLDEPAEEVVA